MIVARYNFETNSSSMHSLSIRRSDGPYSIDELKRSEATSCVECHDAIFVMKNGRRATVEEIKRQLWIGDDDKDYFVSSYETDYKHSAMQVLGDFYGKLHYALATVCGNRSSGWEERLQKIEYVWENLFPNVELLTEMIDQSAGTNDDILFYFLCKNQISLESFLMDSRYVVIVNTEEYQKMRFLDMVDEENIVEAYNMPKQIETPMVIENGVWKIGQEDMRFGRSPYRVLGTVEGKARYALATYKCKNMDEVLSILREVYPDLKSIELPKCWYNPEKDDTGYCEDSAMPINVPLRDFILDKKYVIISDGDEYCIWDNFKKTPMFNREEYPDEKIEMDF